MPCVSAQALRTNVALQLAAEPTTVINVLNAKPMHALVRLREQVPDDAAARAEWRKRARTAAVVGSCPRSLHSLDSGIAHWLKYIAIAHGSINADKMAFPPSLEDVLGWSNTFRCVGTFCDYLTHLRAACHANGFDAPPIGHPAIKRAMVAVVKRELFTKRNKLFVQRCVACSRLHFVFCIFDFVGIQFWFFVLSFCIRH